MSCSISDDLIPPAKKLRTNTTQDSPETPQEYLFLESKEMQMPLSGIPILPENRMSQEPREIPEDYVFLPYKEMEMAMPMSLSSASPIDRDEDSEKTSFVSKTLCMYDETWPCGTSNVTCAPRDEELTEQARNIKEMRFQSKKQKKEENEYGVSTELGLVPDPWIIKRKLTEFDIGKPLYLSGLFVDSHVYRFLTRADKKKLKQGDGIMVNLYDHDTGTTQEMRLTRSNNHHDFYLKDSSSMILLNKPELKRGDKIGLFWNRFHSTLHFQVLSRAIGKEENLSVQ